MNRSPLLVVYAIAFYGALGVLPGHPEHELHLFLSEHWSQDFFSLWEPRWYGGIELSAHPPLLHLLTGFSAKILHLSVEKTYALWIPLICVFFVASISSLLRVAFPKLSGEPLTLVLCLNPVFYLFVFPMAQVPFVLGVALACLALVQALRPIMQTHQDSVAKTVPAPLFQRLVVSTLPAFLFAAAICAHPMAVILPLVAFPVVVAFRIIGGDFILKEHTRGLSYAALSLVAGLLAGLITTAPFWRQVFAGGLRTLTMSKHAVLEQVYLGACITFFLIALVSLATRNTTGIALATSLCLLLIAVLVAPQMGMGMGTDKLILVASIVALVAACIAYNHFAEKMAGGTILLHSFVGLCGVAFLLLCTANLIDPPQAELKRQFRGGLDPVIGILGSSDAQGFGFMTLGLGNEKLELSRRAKAHYLDGGMPWLNSTYVKDSSFISVDDLPLGTPKGIAHLEQVLIDSQAHALRWVVSSEHGAGPVLLRSGFKSRHAWRSGIILWEREVTPEPMQLHATPAPFVRNFIWSAGSLLLFLVAFGLVCTLEVRMLRKSVTL